MSEYCCRSALGRADRNDALADIADHAGDERAADDRVVDTRGRRRADRTSGGVRGEQVAPRDGASVEDAGVALEDHVGTLADRRGSVARDAAALVTDRAPAH